MIYVECLEQFVPLAMNIPWFIPMCSLGLGIGLIGLISCMIWGKR